MTHRHGAHTCTRTQFPQRAGHEYLLKFRARHSAGCYRAYDAMRLCLIRRVTDRDMCEKVGAHTHSLR